MFLVPVKVENLQCIQSSHSHNLRILETAQWASIRRVWKMREVGGRPQVLGTGGEPWRWVPWFYHFLPYIFQRVLREPLTGTTNRPAPRPPKLEESFFSLAKGKAWYNSRKIFWQLLLYFGQTPIEKHSIPSPHPHCQWRWAGSRPKSHPPISQKQEAGL